MYNVIDFHVILDSVLNEAELVTDLNWKDWHPPKYLKLPRSFKECFTSTISESDKKLEKTIDDELLLKRDIKKSPCHDLKNHPMCEEYCNWHKQVIEPWKKEDFLTVMKTANPQRKLIQEPMKAYEKELIEKLFDNPAYFYKTNAFLNF